MNFRLGPWAALLLCGLSHAALADDSSAALGAGGLVLTRNESIRMAREDLTLGPKSVAVRYEFVNDSGRDADTIVAFPLPDVDTSEFYYSPLGATQGRAPNFVGFVLTVDGKPVAATAEERAIYKGRDVTAAVKSAGLPINIAGSDLVAKLDALKPGARAQLVKADLIDVEGERDIHPHWTAVTKFWWRQHFPARKTVVIEHRYVPVTGQSFFTPFELTDHDQVTYNKRFCIDQPTNHRLKEMLADRAARLAKNGDTPLLNAYETDFVLKTARNWSGPIGLFHLTLDKMKPDNVLSLCWNGSLAKTGPARFEATRKDFAPQDDLRLLVVELPR